MTSLFVRLDSIGSWFNSFFSQFFVVLRREEKPSSTVGTLDPIGIDGVLAIPAGDVPSVYISVLHCCSFFLKSEDSGLLIFAKKSMTSIR